MASTSPRAIVTGALLDIVAQEAMLRLDALASAIEHDQLSRLEHERDRLDLLLAAAGDTAPVGDEEGGRLLRSVARMVTLAVARRDAMWCREARSVLRRLCTSPGCH